ncbi:hypothetical protein ACQKGA_29295 [Priestia megaterium]|uniref:hypothetical protein n=1 Tax=Priestia TaxID=2800373 RepID=UPI000BA60F74|nr:hypothetical protein [Priestia megaterium]PAK42960.1 hypothetical protein CHH47_28310 [Priestia megaterium]
MKKICSALFGLLLFISLVGCQSKAEDPLEFSGENQNWSANITLYPVKDSEETVQINLNYLGDKIESVGDFGINFDTATNKNGIAIRDIRLDKKGKFKEKIKVDTSKDVNESEHLVLTVEWNNKSEDIVLKTK